MGRKLKKRLPAIAFIPHLNARVFGFFGWPIEDRNAYLFKHFKVTLNPPMDHYAGASTLITGPKGVLCIIEISWPYDNSPHWHATLAHESVHAAMQILGYLGQRSIATLPEEHEHFTYLVDHIHGTLLDGTMKSAKKKK
jgi:hypothetical protein